MTDYQFDEPFDDAEDGYEEDLVVTVDAGLQPFDDTVGCLRCGERYLNFERNFSIDPEGEVCDECCEQDEEDRQLRSDYYRSVL